MPYAILNRDSVSVCDTMASWLAAAALTLPLAKAKVSKFPCMESK